MLAVLCVALAWSPVALRFPPTSAALRHRAIAMNDAPTLREQMVAYIKSVQERGLELTPEQKEMIAEFEADDELLDQQGMPDFYKGAEVLTPEEFQAQQQDAPAEVPASAMYAPAPTTAPAFIDPAVARMWMVQRNEVDAACTLLARRADGYPLADADARQLRGLLASLSSTVAASLSSTPTPTM